MVVIPLPQRERERGRERERVCVCGVCVGERERGCKVRHSDAVHVGPAWLQWHGCKFITDVNLRQNGGRHTRVKWGKRAIYFN